MFCPRLLAIILYACGANYASKYGFLVGEALKITNHPMNVTVCSGTKANISCGYIGVSDVFNTRPDWRIIKRNNNGSVISNVTVSADDVFDDKNDGLEFIIVERKKAARHSYLSVGPVDDTYNNTSYQCIFTINDTIIESYNAGTITVFVPFPPLVMIETVFNAITLWWSPINNIQCGIVSYVVSRTPAHGVLTRINATAYSITGLDYNTTYNIVVFATSDLGGDGYPANVTVRTISLQSTFKCNATSQKMITNTIEVSCELLETLRKISVTVMCINCYSICSQPITMVGDSPVTISDLVAGQYAVEMAIADNTNINDTIIEIITVSGNDIPINSTTVQMITASNAYTSTMVVTHTVTMGDSGSDGLSTGAAVTITFVLTFIITLTATAVVTFMVTCVCVKRQYESPNDKSPQEEKMSCKEKALYEEVCQPSRTVTKDDLELEPNPAYGTSCEVVIDNNPAYESCK